LFIVSMIFIVSLIVVSFKGFRLRFNFTPSFPIGVYQLETHSNSSLHQQEQLVLVCPPNTSKFHLNNHDFLTKDSECPTKTVPLILSICNMLQSLF